MDMSPKLEIDSRRGVVSLRKILARRPGCLQPELSRSGHQDP